jgi:hypothetical protein
MSRKLIAIALCVLSFAAGWTVRKAAGQDRLQTPVVKTKGELFVFAFAQKNCPYCANMASTWKAIDQDRDNHFAIFTTETTPAQFGVWDVSGTPTTIIGAKTGGDLAWKRVIFRIDGPMTMKDLEPLLIKARAKIDAGLPDWPKSIEEPLPKAEAQ